MRRGKPLTADPARAAEKRARREARRAAEGLRPEDVAREERAAIATRARSDKPRIRGVCICGCKRPAVARHHVVYEQELRKFVAAGRSSRAALPAADRALLAALVSDPRNLAPVAFDCHGAHHLRARPYPLSVLPDSAFEFAAEVLGRRAYGYLRRRYAGRDERLDDLLRMAA